MEIPYCYVGYTINLSISNAVNDSISARNEVKKVVRNISEFASPFFFTRCDEIASHQLEPNQRVENECK